MVLKDTAHSNLAEDLHKEAASYKLTVPPLHVRFGPQELAWDSVDAMTSYILDNALQRSEREQTCWEHRSPLWVMGP